MLFTWDAGRQLHTHIVKHGLQDRAVAGILHHLTADVRLHAAAQAQLVGTSNKVAEQQQCMMMALETSAQPWLGSTTGSHSELTVMLTVAESNTLPYKQLPQQ